MRRPARRRAGERLSHFLHSEKILGRAKTGLIVLLTASAVTLLIFSGMFASNGPHAAAAGGQDTQQQSGGVNMVVSVAGPYVIVVTDGSGSHCGLMYDGTELRQAYDRLSAYLGEAFGSAGEPKSVTEADFQAALKKRGVYFDFAYPQPLSLLSAAIGITMTSSAMDHASSRFCIAVEGDDVALYYYRSKNGAYYRCATAISSAALESKLSDWPSNGANFLFETDYGYNLVDNCFVIEKGQAQLHAVTAQNPVGGNFNPAGLASLFGINGYMAHHYPETDGTDVYVDGNKILRIYTDGTVIFKNSGAVGGGRDPGFSADIAAASKAASATIGSTGGVALPKLTYVGYDEKSGAYTVRYGYEINDCPVSMGSGSAAQFTVVDGVVTEAELHFREYSYSGEDDAPLPAVQVMALVQAKGGGTPLLCYVDNGKSVCAGWTILN